MADVRVLQVWTGRRKAAVSKMQQQWSVVGICCSTVVTVNATGCYLDKGTQVTWASRTENMPIKG